MTALSEFDIPSLQAHLRERGIKPSHSGRLLRAFYESCGRVDPASLPVGKALIGEFGSALQVMQSGISAEHVSSEGTVKFLVGMSDGRAVEAVLIPAFRPDRAAACVSSQIGCAMGCDFCASARGGLVRNLSAGEIVEQFLHLRLRAGQLGRRLSSLVFMGMGEPLHNLANVLAAIERMAHPNLGNLGWRHITVSTVGIVPAMDELASAARPVYLALSLHAPDDATRSRIVPTNRRWPVGEVLEAARRYQGRTGRVVNIEYCLLAGVNDSDEQAHLLCELLRGFGAHVNLIPHNWIGAGLSGVEYRKPTNQRIDRFAEILSNGGVVTHRRVARGDDVSAACGQLRIRAAQLSGAAHA
jgi:23S rRNA (adenine2503-C2)-methyltransferase